MQQTAIEARLYEKLPGSLVQCHVCQWRCKVKPDKLGVCRMRRNLDGVLYVGNYGLASSVAVDPIEKKPLFHFHPGSEAYSLGSWGCNFHCQHCQNWLISCVEPLPQDHSARHISPEEAVAMAKRSQAAGIAWTYNEPGMWLEYTVDTARLAKPQGLYTVYVTNGYSTPEALDEIGPFLDAWRVDLKGFRDEVYRGLAKVRQWRGILDVAKRARSKWNMHVEVVTNVIPGWNDDEAQLTDLAAWVRDELGELTPWHVTRFYPQYRMKDVPATPVSTLEKAYAIGKRAGLRFVYVGNVPAHDGENTVCYSCNRTVVRRVGFQASVVGLDGSCCKHCGADLNMRV